MTDETNVEHDFENFRKYLKNENAVRDIPIHPELIKMGFIDWLKDKPPGRIFRELSPAKNGKLSTKYSKHYRQFGEKLGVWEYRKKVFHSYRNNLNAALEENEVPEERRTQLNGWEAQSKMDKKYGKAKKVKLLYSEICKLQYTGLDLQHLYEHAKSWASIKV